MPIPLAMSRTEVLCPQAHCCRATRSSSYPQMVQSSAGTFPWLGSRHVGHPGRGIHPSGKRKCGLVHPLACGNPSRCAGNAVKANMQETCISSDPGNPGFNDKPSSGVKADGVHNDSILSTTIVLTELGRDLVKADNLLSELYVVS
jgi:hypothetical protein